MIKNGLNSKSHMSKVPWKQVGKKLPWGVCHPHYSFLIQFHLTIFGFLGLHCCIGLCSSSGKQGQLSSGWCAGFSLSWPLSSLLLLWSTHGLQGARASVVSAPGFQSVLVIQSCLTVCSPTDCSPPGSSVHRILQARILEWVAMPFSRRSSQPRDQTWALVQRLNGCDAQAQLSRIMWNLPRSGIRPMSPALTGRFVTTEPPRKPK